jgi:hypothetical protein
VLGGEVADLRPVGLVDDHGLVVELGQDVPAAGGPALALFQVRFCLESHESHFPCELTVGVVQSLYSARYAGQAPRPPRTLVEQEAFVREVTVERTLTVHQLEQVTALAPLAGYERPGPKVEKLRREDLSAYGQSAAALAQFGEQFLDMDLSHSRRAFSALVLPRASRPAPA